MSKVRENKSPNSKFNNIQDYDKKHKKIKNYNKSIVQKPPPSPTIPLTKPPLIIRDPKTATKSIFSNVPKTPIKSRIPEEASVLKIPITSTRLTKPLPKQLSVPKSPTKTMIPLPKKLSIQKIPVTPTKPLIKQHSVLIIPEPKSPTKLIKLLPKQPSVPKIIVPKTPIKSTRKPKSSNKTIRSLSKSSMKTKRAILKSPAKSKTVVLKKKTRSISKSPTKSKRTMSNSPTKSKTSILKAPKLRIQNIPKISLTRANLSNLSKPKSPIQEKLDAHFRYWKNVKIKHQSLQDQKDHMFDMVPLLCSDPLKYSNTRNSRKDQPSYDLKNFNRKISLERESKKRSTRSKKSHNSPGKRSNKTTKSHKHSKKSSSNESLNISQISETTFDLIVHPTLPKLDKCISNETKKNNHTRKIFIYAPTIYPIVRVVAAKFGFKQVTIHDPWMLLWTDVPLDIEKCQFLKPYQRINHFPGISMLCQKNLLASNLKRLARQYPEEYDFFPKTWCLPEDLGDFLIYARNTRNTNYICKPEVGSRGKGIFITQSLRDINPYKPIICQIYINRPYLIDGFKFDLRIYTLITHCNPMRIFVYNEGLARFATHRYQEPSPKNLHNNFMHLTNYAINRHSKAYVSNEQYGTKRRLSTVTKHMSAHGVNVKQLWYQIDQVIVKTLLSTENILKEAYDYCFPFHNAFHGCFDLLGFDIMLDQHLKPIILEVNHSPSFYTDSKLDREIKQALLVDTFQLLDVTHEGSRFSIVEDLRQEDVKKYYLDEKSVAPDEGLANLYKFQDLNKDYWLQQQQQWEQEHLGNFRLIYPTMKNEDQYKYLIKQKPGK